MLRTRRPLVALGGALLVGALVLGACSSSKKSSDTSTTVTPTSTSVAAGQTAKFDTSVQQQLADVGCYTGNVDGIMGPETDAAIVAFQTAAGLKVDGQLGPQTESVLSADASAHKKVCESATSTSSATTSTTTGGTAPCTATALLAALDSGSELTGYVCSDGFAGVTATTTNQSAYSAVLQADGSTWKDLGSEPCGTASAGIAPDVLTMGCSITKSARRPGTGARSVRSVRSVRAVRLPDRRAGRRVDLPGWPRRRCVAAGAGRSRRGRW